MDKKLIIGQLRKAKTAHIRWRSYAQAVVSGVPVDEGRVPVFHTDCEFGRWYYGDGQALAHLPGFNDIAKPHEQLHAVYMEIFKHLFEDESISLLGRLIGKKAKVEAQKQRAVQSLLNELIKISDQLVGHIERLERSVAKLPEEEFAEMY